MQVSNLELNAVSHICKLRSVNLKGMKLKQLEKTKAGKQNHGTVHKRPYYQW